MVKVEEGDGPDQGMKSSRWFDLEGSSYLLEGLVLDTEGERREERSFLHWAAVRTECRRWHRSGGRLMRGLALALLLSSYVWGKRHRRQRGESRLEDDRGLETQAAENQSHGIRCWLVL